MALGVLLWALGHLLATAMLADVVLFGAFLLWAVCSLLAALHRDRRARVAHASGTLAGTLVTIAIGVAAWAVFAFWAHPVLIGVRPF